MTTIWAFDHTENEHHSFISRKIKMQEIVTFVEEESLKSFLKVLIIEKLEIIAFLQVNTAVQHTVFVHLKFNLPSEIPILFHSSSNYDFHFIIKELANEFDGQFECIGENRER